MKIMDSISKYNQPDPIWTIFKANSHEEYIEKFVVKGLFHQAVHEDVVKSYETVEHTIALAYYHYPLLDVALNKLLGTYEMAIKLRCAELGIEKTYLDKKGKTKTKNLNTFIEELIKEGLTPDYKSTLHHLRDLRNFSAHPERNTLMGTLSLGVMMPALNVINKLFLPQCDHQEWKEVSENMQNNFVFEESTIFILEHQNQRVLVYQPEHIDSFKIGDAWCHAISFLPVLANTKELLSEHKIPDGIVRFLSNIIIGEKGISAFDMEINQTTFIEYTDNEKNINTYKLHLAQLRELDEVDAGIFENTLQDFCYRKAQKFVYQNCWTSCNN